MPSIGVTVLDVKVRKCLPLLEAFSGCVWVSFLQTTMRTPVSRSVSQFHIMHGTVCQCVVQCGVLHCLVCQHVVQVWVCMLFLWYAL